MNKNKDLSHVIAMTDAVTLDGLFRERVRRTPDLVAYKAYNEQHRNWRDYSWAQINRQVARWQAALEKDGLQPGDRVGVMLRNSPEWVMFDQAALGLGLVVVPLYTQDRAENVAYIVNNSECKVLLVEGDEQWLALHDVAGEMRTVVRFLTVNAAQSAPGDARLKWIGEWLPADGGATRHLSRPGNTLATIVYTSGTTGRPKGVMLSHDNILSNTASALTVLATGHDDIFMSFLPLSHTFEGGLRALDSATGRGFADRAADHAGFSAAHLRAHLGRDPRQTRRRFAAAQKTVSACGGRWLCPL